MAVEGATVTTDAKFTRCPGCSTVFRVTVAQLALREGQVRCGHCRAVFDANDHLVSLDATISSDEFDTSDELLMGRPTVTLRTADALRPIEEVPAEAAHDVTSTSAVTVERQLKEKDGDESVDSDVEQAVVEPAAKRLEVLPEETDDARAADGEMAVAPTDKQFGDTASTTKTIEAANANASDDETATVEASNTAATIEHTAGDDEIRDSTSRGATEIAEDGASTSTGSSTSVADDDERPTEANDEPHAEVASIDLARPGTSARFEWKKRRTTEGSKRKRFVVAAVALVAAIVLQGVLEFRDSLAARVPVLRPWLEAACSVIGCTIAPLRDGGALSIDASDLQADPAHRGLLLLSATIRNRSSHAIAYPLLELTLTDSSDQVVARRAFTPAEYAGATADTAVGIPPNGERIVRMFLDASATQQAGYRLYLFYP